jgi:uncharacterized peroxidase-related enzyme
MSQFKVHTLESAPEGSRPTLEAIRKAYGFIPNLFGTLAESPAAVESYAAVSSALSRGRLSPAERQVLAISISAENGCEYCVAAHSTSAAMQKVPAETVAALRDAKPLRDRKLQALRTFALEAVRKRGWLDPTDVEAFLAAGYDRGHLLEVLTWVSLKTLSNYTNHLAKTPLDAAFSGQKWSKAGKAA